MVEMFKACDFNNKTDYNINEVNGIKLSKDYLEFMSKNNWWERTIGKNIYGCFYNLEELVDVNDIEEKYGLQFDWR